CLRSPTGPPAHHRVQRPGVGKKANGPDANVFVDVMKLCAKKGLIQGADAVQGPERAKLDDGVGVSFIQFVQMFLRAADFTSALHACGEFDARLARKPFIEMGMQLYKFDDSQLRDVANGAGPGLTVGDLEYPPASAMDAGVFVTFTCVAPVENEYPA